MASPVDSPDCPIGSPAGHVGMGYFEALSNLTADQVRLALGHFRHWAGHQFGPGREDFLEYVDSHHQELHWLVEGCGWTEGVLILLVGEFFDANVACGERWGLEPMERLRDTGSWTLAFELHRHGDRLCSGTAELNCELLGLAASFGALVSARALAYDGTPGVELGSWLVSPQDGFTTRATTWTTSSTSE
jgi:hypothetical protein